MRKELFFSFILSAVLIIGRLTLQDWARADEYRIETNTENATTTESQETVKKETIIVDPCADYRKIHKLPHWRRLNDECRSSNYVDMSGIETREERILWLFQNFGYTYAEAKELWDIYRSAGRIERIRGEFLVCIAYADSGLGKKMLTENNPGNVGNNDRGHKKHFETMEQGIYAIARTLNNRYLGHKSTLIELSLYESQKAGLPIDYYYASGKNRAMNIENCESMLLGENIGVDFNYRF